MGWVFDGFVGGSVLAPVPQVIVVQVSVGGAAVAVGGGTPGSGARGLVGGTPGRGARGCDAGVGTSGRSGTPGGGWGGCCCGAVVHL